MSFLIGKKVILRPVCLNDIEGPYSEWINDQTADIYTEHAQFPKGAENLRRFYENRNDSPNDIWLAIVMKDSKKHVGNIELSDIDWVHRKARFLIVIGDISAQRHGIGYEASALLLSHVFNKLNLNRVELGVHEYNKYAIKLYKKLGFKEEGRQRKGFLRNGSYVDVIIMGMLSSEFIK